MFLADQASYFYLIWHILNCQDNFSNSYINDELLYMNGGFLHYPIEPLHPTLHLSPLF